MLLTAFYMFFFNLFKVTAHFLLMETHSIDMSPEEDFKMCWFIHDSMKDFNKLLLVLSNSTKKVKSPL